MAKLAVIDIDNTLWDFSQILYKELKALNPSLPPPEKWERWDFFKDYISPKDFYRKIEEIHRRQDEYDVYSEAKDFLSGLKNLGFRVVIASHRSKNAERATLRWLEKHGLSFDELHISYDKTVLFPYCKVIVDDSPLILEKAKMYEILAVGLEHPWNRGNGFLLFSNLLDILTFIEEHVKI